ATQEDQAQIPLKAWHHAKNRRHPERVCSHKMMPRWKVQRASRAMERFVEGWARRNVERPDRAPFILAQLPPLQQDIVCSRCQESARLTAKRHYSPTHRFK